MKLAIIVLPAVLACALATPAQAQSVPTQAPGQPAPPPASQAPGAVPAQPANGQVAPPGVPQMRLSEVLAITARQEPSLLRATIDVRIAEAAVLEAAGIDDWVLQVSGGWRTQRVLSGVNALQNAFELGADLSRSLSTGGTLTLHADTNISNNPFVNDSGFLYSHTVTAGLTQPLWSGFGEKYARSAQARAEIARSAAELDLERAALNAVRQVIAAYWELAYAWRDLEIRRASLALGEEQLRNTQARIAAGAVAPTEALAVEQSLASREESIVLAQVSITDRSLALRDLAGLEIGPGEVALWADAPLDITPQQLDVNALLAQALAQSPTLQALKVRRQDLELAVALAKDDGDPALDLSLLVGPTGSGDSVGEAFEGLVRLREPTVNARLTLRHELGQRGARGRLAAARGRLEQYSIDIGLAETAIKRDLILAVGQAEAAQRIVLSERVIALAEKNIEAERARFELGRATNFDVLQRQDELEQAQLRRARAVYDYLQALTAIDAITGGLLARYGIALEPAGS